MTGADLGPPAATVRGWNRRAAARAQWLRVQGTTLAHECDPMLPAVLPVGSEPAEALSALGLAAAVVVGLLGPIAPPWQIMAVVARDQLLAPLRSD